MTILGPDGRPVRTGSSMTLDDETRTMTVEHRGEKASGDPKLVLMEMARAQIRGWSHRQIISHYQLVGQAASPFVLERALTKGRALLQHAIRTGEVDADILERPVTDPIDYASIKDDDDDDDV